ncbi:serine/threonine protein kinase [Thiorhodovibrio litoralis]|uniref:serine/threonine protein kinase n=1 Tax=Thiorhodovibrio litoralis TaxID=2952932 RepID=UPI002B25F8FA|nr:protein kinase [Thiorhodovibrio litoralis]
MSPQIFPEGSETISCPNCQATNSVRELPQKEYRCCDCGFELAHLDMTIHGSVRGVIAWVRSPGQVVNERYKVTGLLGRGGFGVTYLVDDLLVEGKRRALKEIPEILFDEYETRLLGRLNHPAIPDITDRFSDQGMNCLVLEFGGNRTLRSEQKRYGGRIPLPVLLPWIRQLSEAIIYLHNQNPPIIHRDLKPDNILLDDNDRVMLIDFGIAKEAVAEGMTRTLGRAASQGFSPPEQVLGTGTDERSDVYSLGAVVYNLLTGTMPVAAYDRVTGSLLEPIKEVLPDVPPEVDAAVLKALELNINLRHESISALMQCLDPVQQSAPVEPGSETMILDPSLDQLTAFGNRNDTSASAPLPSLRLPTGRSAPPVSEADSSPRQQKQLWIGAGVGLLLIAAAGIWWLLGTPGLNGSPPLMAAESGEASQTEDPNNPESSQAGENPEQEQEATERSGNNADHLATAATAAGIAAAGAVGAGSAAGLKGRAATQNTQSAGTNAVARASQESLPSIFSNEQSPEPQRTSASNGSLMDVFDQNRGEATALSSTDTPQTQTDASASSATSSTQAGATSSKTSQPRTSSARVAPTIRKPAAVKRAPVPIQKQRIAKGNARKPAPVRRAPPKRARIKRAPKRRAPVRR